MNPNCRSEIDGYMGFDLRGYGESVELRPVEFNCPALLELFISGGIVLSTLS